MSAAASHGVLCASGKHEAEGKRLLWLQNRLRAQLRKPCLFVLTRISREIKTLKHLAPRTERLCRGCVHLATGMRHLTERERDTRVRQRLLKAISNVNAVIHTGTEW